MSTEDNKALARRLLEAFWHQKNLPLADEVLHANHVLHGPGNLGKPVQGPAEFKDFHSLYLTAFPDIHVTIEDQIAEGDKVVTRWSASGTHTGSFFGKPATNKSFTITGMVLDHFVGGQLVETWANFDYLGLLQQLGLVPDWTQSD